MCAILLYMEDLDRLIVNLKPEEVRAKAEAGNSQSQYYLAMMLAKGINTDVDMNESFKWMEKASMSGIAFAMNNLGYFYEHGMGCDEDPEHAFLWYDKAAKEGLPPAYLNVYHCYAHGIGVPQNMEKAFDMLKKAAAEGISEAKVYLADFYWEQKKDAKQMLYWYEKAIKEDHSAFAMFGLACNYSRGIGVKQNMRKAQTLLKKSADNGYEDAAMILAQQYERRGKYQDAYKYYTIAAKAGNRNAMAILIDQYQ